MSKLLCVDDDPQILALLRRFGELHGFSVVTAANGEDGLFAALEHSPDLAILDVNMPEKDGRDLCRELKADPKTKDILVLFLSARADQFSRRLCLELGAEDFLEKPFDMDGLMRKVRYLLVKHQRA